MTVYAAVIAVTKTCLTSRSDPPAHTYTGMRTSTILGENCHLDVPEVKTQK